MESLDLIQAKWDAVVRPAHINHWRFDSEEEVAVRHKPLKTKCDTVERVQDGWVLRLKEEKSKVIIFCNDLPRIFCEEWDRNKNVARPLSNHAFTLMFVEKYAGATRGDLRFLINTLPRSKVSQPPPPLPQQQARWPKGLRVGPSWLDPRPTNITTNAEILKVVHILREGRRIRFFTGAGVSVACNIPDFRSKTGLFSQKGIKDVFYGSIFNSEAGERLHHRVMGTLAKDILAADPSGFHYMLAHLAQEGRLQRVYTQNIDGMENRFTFLETKVPLPMAPPYPLTIPLHGGIELTRCPKCNSLRELYPPDHLDFTDLECVQCQTLNAEYSRKHCRKRYRDPGRRRPNVVLYEDTLPDGDGEAKARVIQYDTQMFADVMVAVGTKLSVDAAMRSFSVLAKGMKAVNPTSVTIWIGFDDPPRKENFYQLFDEIIHCDCQDVAEAYRASFQPAPCM